MISAGGKKSTEKTLVLLHVLRAALAAGELDGSIACKLG